MTAPTGLTEPTMIPPAGGVTVRMYRHGLGDCFLLAFPTRRGKRPCYVLIDCGVLMGTEKAKEKMEAVAASLRDSTGGRIDVLVATHQHWDHLSGFVQAQDVFKDIEIGEVWVAWTEDPDNPRAQSLRARRATSVRALHAAAQGLRATGDADGAGSLEEILGFFGELGADGRPSRIEAALAYVLGRGNPPRYLAPRDLLDLPGVAGARVYVLGPPQDETLLRRSDPSSQPGEVYEKRLALDEQNAFFAAALAATSQIADADDEELKNLAFPFEKTYRVAFSDAEQDAFFQEHYYSAEAQDWRRIDGDWLGTASQLALQLDSDTNNTSLALAIELLPSGKVLLFPADAQVGNWESWHKLQWPREDETQAPVTARDLLHRTTLYKVGHHASHNATLRAQGLELMDSPELVALIPVDEAMAHKPKGGNPDGWDMPFGPLLRRLREKTKGRLLRADQDLPARPASANPIEWERFVKSCSSSEDRLYHEVTVDNSGPRKRPPR
ncbi:MAG TPA: MBL fold metallo-hydrolase [Thermoanaerobaculia bacterium]|jgi:hypothetical protein|nr:MBL fold metallo-hydrolase [Thermoanaerobaculia bacterium]